MTFGLRLVLSGFYLMLVGLCVPGMRAVCNWLEDMPRFWFYIGWCLFVGIVWNGAVWCSYIFS